MWRSSLAVGSGFFVGALSSALPYLLMLVPLAAFGCIVVFRGTAMRHTALCAAGALAALVVAAEAPTKMMNAPVRTLLPATVLSVDELCQSRSEFICGDGVAHPFGWLSLPTRRPTYAELDAALADRGLMVRFGVCGSGASLLFGGHRMGRVYIARR